MKHVNYGFTILLMLSFMMIFTLLAGIFIRSSSLLQLFALERQEHEYQYWAAYGLLQYAKVEGEKKESQEPIHIAHWPLATSNYKGLIQVMQEENMRIYTVQLMRNGIVLQRMTCKKPIAL